jgi:hypothetical protein
MGDGKSGSRFPKGMTERKARAKARTGGSRFLAGLGMTARETKATARASKAAG